MITSHELELIIVIRTDVRAAKLN